MLVLLPAAVLAHSQYQAYVPNGYVNGYNTGHAGGAGAFRWPFRDANYTWTTALCLMDTAGTARAMAWSSATRAAFGGLATCPRIRQTSLLLD